MFQATRRTNTVGDAQAVRYRQTVRVDGHHNHQQNLHPRIGAFSVSVQNQLKIRLSESAFRKEHWIAENNTDQSGSETQLMKSIPIIEMIGILMMRFPSFLLKRIRSWAVVEMAFNW